MKGLRLTRKNWLFDERLLIITLWCGLWFDLILIFQPNIYTIHRTTGGGDGDGGKTSFQWHQVQVTLAFFFFFDAINDFHNFCWLMAHTVYIYTFIIYLIKTFCVFVKKFCCTFVSCSCRMCVCHYMVSVFYIFIISYKMHMTFYHHCLPLTNFIFIACIVINFYMIFCLSVFVFFFVLLVCSNHYCRKYYICSVYYLESG